MHLVRHRITSALLLSLLCIGLPLTAARGEAGGGPASRACPEHDIDVWMVSTRRLPLVCLPVTDADFRVERRDAGGCWHTATVEELVATDGPLVFFIHGNRYDEGSARRQEVSLAGRLARCRPDTPGIRTVVFSWPSESRGRPLREARDNFRRAEADGHYFGALLGRVGPASDVGIVAYSFGCKIALVGLTDAGAVRPGWRSDRTGGLGLVLVTPAVSVCSLSPSGRHHAAITSVDRLTVLTNPRDEALRFFPFVDPSGGEAAGFVGIPRRWLPPDLAFLQRDASPIVGKEHSMQRFIDSRTLSCLIADGAIE